MVVCRVQVLPQAMKGCRSLTVLVLLHPEMCLWKNTSAFFQNVLNGKYRCRICLEREFFTIFFFPYLLASYIQEQTSSSSCFIVLKCYSDLSDAIVKNKNL